ncbi:hypothetical protein [Seleniivibrio sp.]|uniref:flagellar assembly protein T N-terminal domain-containing protein n=1 Tax=Seleniivibrio sp. TaxID=2898801 RepID=UPI0025F58DD2|nr:hypothetical protein [Seleniivibrio sp.]MCD8552911.1 hypothetical protein [Seleniivibrio sp.]
MRKLLLSLTLFMLTVSAFAAVTVSAVGEADIINGDKSSAKLQATARAKWAALEEASGVRVKSDTIVQNAVLVDEAIKNEVSGVVQSYKVTGEEEDGQIYRIMISAVVSPEKAKDAIGAIAMNTSVAVMIPVVFPDKHVEETNVLTETVISELTANQLEVIDIADASGTKTAELDRAMRTNNYMAMRAIASKYLSGTILIGKVDTVATAKEGTDIGYGVSIPFNVVTGRLSYRLLVQQGSGTKILASDFISARGMGATLEDATHQMMDNMNNEVSTKLVSTVLEKIKGINSKNIRVQLVGKTTLEDLMDLKQTLSYTAWVLEVNDNGKDTLDVKYPEKALYLATAISSKPNYKIVRLNDYLIQVQKLY